MPVGPTPSLPGVGPGPVGRGEARPAVGSAGFLGGVFTIFLLQMGPTSRETGPNYVGGAGVTTGDVRAMSGRVPGSYALVARGLWDISAV